MESLFSEIKIVWKDPDFLIINKPAGILSHKKNENDREFSLADWLLEHYPETRNVGENQLRPGIVHRLDRETSGLMIVARNSRSFEYFKNIFQERKIKKQYLALVFGELSSQSGIIDKPIGILKSSVKRSTSAKGLREVKEALTKYLVREIFKRENGSFSLLEVWPKTGRTNQIRVHLSSIGHSICGDKIYKPKKNSDLAGLNRMFLHAYSLEFVSSSGQAVKAEAALPEELTDFLEKIAG